MSKQIIFSGIQPSGNLHIGNYIGAIQQWVGLQNNSICHPDSSTFQSRVEGSLSEKQGIPAPPLKLKAARGRLTLGMTEDGENDLIFCVVDLHAITVHQNPKILKEKNLEVAALYMACGIDPEKSHIFIQSENPDHSYLAWIFDCLLNMGDLFRMTQFKDKINKQFGKGTFSEVRGLFQGSVGLFNYPALMAADILLYDTTHVPVGEDQVQHVELTRDIGEKFNRLYCHPEQRRGYSPATREIAFERDSSIPFHSTRNDNKTCIFTLPKPMIDKESARIMSLQNPMSKMSKSDADPLGTINLLDTPDVIEKKVKRAVTDSGTEIVYEADKPAIANLLVIYSKLSGRAIDSIEADYKNKSYAEFKKDLADVVIKALKPIQDRYHEIRRDEKYLNDALDDGLHFTLERSNKKIEQVKKAIGLCRGAS